MSAPVVSANVSAIKYITKSLTKESVTCPATQLRVRTFQLPLYQTQFFKAEKVNCYYAPILSLPLPHSKGKVTSIHATKKGSGDMASISLNIGTRWRSVVRLTLQPVNLRRKSPLIPLTRRLGRPKTGLDYAVKRNLQLSIMQFPSLFSSATYSVWKCSGQVERKEERQGVLGMVIVDGKSMERQLCYRS
jgi:hypothetical protein